MKQANTHNPLDILYRELKEEDRKYGGKKLKKAETDVHKKRPVKNLKKAWEQCEDDFDEHDEFYGD